MRNRLRIAVLIYSMTNAVIFGAAIITVLNVPALSTNAYIWIPVVVVASLILAAPIAWLIAPRLQARYDRWHTKRDGDPWRTRCHLAPTGNASTSSQSHKL